ncbi:MAG: hypothetical protein PVG65_01315 [Candidatus Thorarchaeota archaeon]|jgi:hypothetical protein
MPISEGRSRKIALLTIILFFFSYPLQGVSFEFINQDIFHQLLASIMIVLGYPLMWSAISISVLGHSGVETAKRRFRISGPLYLIFMGYLGIVLFPPLLASGFDNISPILFLIGFFLALLNLYLISYIIHLEDRLDGLKKKIRKRRVRSTEDLRAFKELNDAVGIAKVLTSHEDVQIRRAAVDLLFEIADPKMIRYVKKALQYDDPYVQLKSAVILCLWCDKGGWTLIQERFRELPAKDRLEIINWIPECEWKGSRAILEQALDDDVQEIRKLAADLIDYF